MAPQPANGGIATCPRNRRDILNRLLTVVQPKEELEVRHGPRKNQERER